ncbi:helix-turn-helix domain-containing protein [Erythrobacter sp. SDW2]|uniref:helix-turn-helix domain-containing protein n=1 Tax=Erythrobacter sp. SDW2 TaxID=2907154 RepID=UPI001F3CC041|nr:helix-turn-helix domain-containing protein [Erythrobacter sp. SDW2]UIP07651.1 helix-turn-helix domain-containing protein [Erythrobacter sp. SDW2]
MAIPGLLVPTSNADSGRDSPRRAVRLATEGLRANGEETLVRLHNISASGLMLESDVRLEKGEKVMIDLPLAGPTPARVVWRSASLHGCRFDQPLSLAVLSASELKSAIAPPEQTPPAQGPALGSLGKRLATLRQKRGLTLAQVAEQLGVSKPTVWAWEHDRSQPVASRIGALADTLGVAEAELITGRDISHAEAAIAEARQVIADAYGCSPQQVRIMIDL